jgi:hypothetical protein
MFYFTDRILKIEPNAFQYMCIHQKSKMGFDFNIMLRLYVDPKTGLPCTYSPVNGRKLVYTVEAWKVPEEFSDFIVQRGHYLRWYTVNMETSIHDFSGDAETFLHYFPKWEAIEKCENWELYGWNEEKHNQFKKCVEWCASKGGFKMMWSY